MSARSEKNDSLPRSDRGKTMCQKSALGVVNATPTKRVPVSRAGKSQRSQWSWRVLVDDFDQLAAEQRSVHDKQGAVGH